MRTKCLTWLAAVAPAAALALMTLVSAFGQPISTVEFIDSGSYVYEDAVAVILFVRRSGDLSGTVTVDYATADGDAKAGEDYTKTKGTLTFGPGETVQSISVPILNDGRKESGLLEYFDIGLSNPSSGVRLGQPADQKLKIADNDVGAEFSETTYWISEDAGQATITVRRGDDGPGTVSVDYATRGGTATPGADYVEQTGTLTFAPGEMSKTLTIPILNDPLTETSESFVLTLRNTTGAAGLGFNPTATLTIEDNDIGIRFANEVWTDLGLLFTVSEGAGQAIITVSNTGDFTNASTVTYSTADDTAKAGTDYVTTTGTMTFQPGETNKTFAVPILDNSVRDGRRTLTLSLRDAGGAVGVQQPASRLLSIEDNERPVRRTDGSPVTYEFGQESYLVSETETAAKLVVIRRGDTSRAGSVEYATTGGTAMANADYVVASGRLEFAPLETEKTITIPLNDDRLVEDDETTQIALNNPGDGSGLDFQRTATLRINDNERPGSLDLSFDAGFIRNAKYGGVLALALQADGRILIAGHIGAINGVRRTGIARLLPDGAVDPAFVPQAWIDGHQLAVQRDGKILAGYSFFTRLNPDGSVDPLYHEPSGNRGGVNVLLIQSDGRIIREGVNGTIRSFPDGSIDPSFRMLPGQDQSGMFALQTDDKLVFAASTVVRFNSDGSPDASFKTVELSRKDIQSEDRFAAGVAVQADGKVVVVGNFDHVNGVPRRSLARINSDGSLDESFDAGAGLTAVEPPSGFGPTTWPLAFQPDGKILVGGYFTHVNGVPRRSIVRLNPNGSVDQAFDPGASISGRGGNVRAIAVQPDGQILIAGGFDQFNGAPRYEIARLNGDRHLLRLTATWSSATGRLRLSVNSQSGKSYTLQASTDLVNWSSVAAKMAIGGNLQFDEASVTTNQRLFYRVLSD